MTKTDTNCGVIDFEKHPYWLQPFGDYTPLESFGYPHLFRHRHLALPGGDRANPAPRRILAWTPSFTGGGCPQHRPGDFQTGLP